ncbi:MAG: C25 family cysteine peptidase, partial [Cyclobacteriaceae bacterium]|nr:C25 family cysteine peptidase [Cyclobacteriaceae bacterium]
MPGSDMNYTVGLKGTTYEPAVPTGRLTATSANQVAAYLNKIKEFEATPAGALWQKKGLHLSGGIFPAELPTFRNYVDGFKAIGEGEFWGSAIKTIAKREPSQVELINISDEINSGVNLVTFFGHSSAGTIDIDIGYVSDPVMGYDNPSKYPVFLINGCNAGSFFLNGVVFGEDWINTSNKGARNFIAHSSFGFTTTLQYYSNLFYSIGFADSTFIKKGIGDIQKEVARVYMQTAAATIQNITQVQQMMLLGDPAVKLFTASKPDYQISNNDISLFSFDNRPVTTLTDSFALKLVVKNLGLAKPKPFKIEVFRTLTNGSTLRYDSLYAPVNYADTLLFTIRRGNELGGGNNSFRVVIDADDTIDELNEDNNEATLNAFIASNSTLNLFPFNYAIVNQTQVSLTWQATDPLSEQREFQIEMDTTLLFNSAYLKKKVVSAKVLASAQFDLLESDSVVYYWRTRFDKPESNESGQWQVSSFSYIKNSGEGWAQLRKNQLKDNFFSGIVDQGEGKPFVFAEQVTKIDITTYGSNHPSTNTDVSVKINGAEYNLSTQGQPCRDNTINLVAFNKSTAVPYAAIPFIFQDPRTCGREPQLINSFRANELQTGFLDDMIEVINRIAVSDSVVLFSIGDAGFNLWSNEVKLKLGEIGVSLSDLNDLQAGEPIIIYGRKGATPGTATLIRTALTPVNEQVVTDTRTITGRRTEGLMKSPLIGPAQAWIQLQLKNPSLELSDTINFVIYGVDSAGNETLITEEATHGYDLSQVSTSEFPYLRIEYRAEDEINLTPADWINWLVLYEPVAEGILLYDEAVRMKTVQEGEPWSSAYRFTNISQKNFNGPLLVEVEIYSKDLQTRSFHTFEIDSPTPGASTLFDITSSTIGKAGANDVSVIVNNQIKPEQYYDNNIVSISDHLIVIADKIPPVLEVTFDGRLLINGDYTSPNPTIQIVLKDENEFLLQTDTLGMNIFLGTSCNQEECVYKRIPFSSSQVKWY